MQEVAYIEDVLRLGDEGARHEIDLMLDAEEKVALVLFRKISEVELFSGKNMDLRLESSPPMTTLQTTLGAWALTTSKTISPLFKRILSPGFMSAQMP